MSVSKQRQATGKGKIFVCGEPCSAEVQIYKKPSFSERKKITKERIKESYSDSQQYVHVDKEQDHWGLFHIKGWKCLHLYDSEEEAIKDLEHKNKYGLYEIRKVSW